MRGFLLSLSMRCTAAKLSLESLTIDLVALSNVEIQTDAPVHKTVDVACIPEIRWMDYLIRGNIYDRQYS